jgi:DNA replication protein DnaC
MNKLNALYDNLEILKFTEMRDMIIDENFCDENFINFMYEATKKEIDKKDERAKNQMIKTSSFPVVKTIEEFDFDFNEEINKAKIMSLIKLDFTIANENILFIGTPGVGKTHLATAIGVETASKRMSTYFIKCKKLLDDLRLAHTENRLEKRLKQFSKYKLLIIDEIGFLPINENDAKLLFQLIDKRYESKSTIITTNILLEKWDTIFEDSLIANAILDRLLHHSHIIKIIGSSYRIKNRD